MPYPSPTPIRAASSNSLSRPFDELAPLGTRRRHAAGNRVVCEGDPGASLFLVFSGRLRATVAGPADRVIELNEIGPGEIFGELSLALGTRTASVEVLASAHLGEVACADVHALLLRQPALAVDLVGSLIGRVGFLTQRVRGLVSMDVYGRMVDLLQRMAQAEDGQSDLPRLTQQAIAERIGASRGMVNKLLHDLVRGGYLVIERDRMVLLRPLPRHW